MKVIHVIPNLNKGGAERLVIDICNELSKIEGMETKLITFSNTNEYQYLIKNFDWVVIPSNVELSVLRKNKTHLEGLQKFITDFQPDIIHTHLFEAEMLSRWKPVSGVRYITHCHDNMKQFRNFSFETLIKKELFTNFYEKQIILKRYKKCNNHFIAISNDTEQYFKKTLPQSLSKNIHTLPNAINYNRFNNPEKTKQGFDKNAYVKLISVGSLVDKKNQIFLVDVVKALHLKNYKVQLDLLGDGQNKIIIEKKILDYNLQDYISLKGNISNVEDYLHNSTIYVHSATYEPYGLVLLEAMAAGLPVVCLDGKGNRDLIEEGKNGFMLYGQNPELFAETIIELIENKQLYSEISNYAKEYARKYDIKEYVDNLLVIYKS